MAENNTNIMASSSSNSHLHHHHLDLQQQLLPHHHHHEEDDDHENNISFSMMQSSSPPFFNPGAGAAANNNVNTASYDLGELDDQALFLYLHGVPQPTQNHNSSSPPGEGGGGGGMIRPPTLNIFPSLPMHATSGTLIIGGEGEGALPSTSGASRTPPSSKVNQNDNPNPLVQPSKSIKREGNHKGQEGPKTPDSKTLRRLAQNREAARKSRLRKKAYVQQLESSRIRLAQLEQELQRARAQGIFLGGVHDQCIPAVGVTNISPDAAVFDLEHTRWLEENQRLTCELRAAVNGPMPENELKLYVENWLGHYDMLMNLKSMVAKTDVFHLVSGMWKTPTERCFMWIGGFRPSHLIKIIVHQIEPLTEQQLMAICGLQQSSHEAEEALSQGLEALNQSLSDVIASDSLSCIPNVANYMGQMALAMSKLSTTENFVRQADNLRQQTFHRLHQFLTIRQTARCFLAIAEYFHRLRAVSSLWLARPRQDQ